MYDIYIPTDIMAAVVEKYGDSKSKQELEEIARIAYKGVQSEYNASSSQVKDGIVQTAMDIVEVKYGPGSTSTYTNTPLTPKSETSSPSNSLTPGAAKSAPSDTAPAIIKDNNHTWLLIAVGAVVIVSIVIIIKYK
jgi:hypothetical protein